MSAHAFLQSLGVHVRYSNMVASWLGVPAFGLATSIIGNISVVSVKAMKDPCDPTGGPRLKTTFVLLHLVNFKFSCETVLGPGGGGGGGGLKKKKRMGAGGTRWVGGRPDRP